MSSCRERTCIRPVYRSSPRYAVKPPHGGAGTLAALLLATACHAYQRDPGYAAGRAAEVASNPMHPNNVKYLIVFGAIAGLLFTVIGVILFAVLRRRPSTSRDGS